MAAKETKSHKIGRGSRQMKRARYNAESRGDKNKRRKVMKELKRQSRLSGQTIEALALKWGVKV